MINSYWYNTITLTYGYAGSSENGWRASVGFYDAGFNSDDVDKGIISTEGTLHTRYVVRDTEKTPAILAVLEVLVNDLQKLGITRSLNELAVSVRTQDGPADDATGTPEADIELLKEYAEKNNYVLYLGKG